MKRALFAGALACVAGGCRAPAKEAAAPTFAPPPDLTLEDYERLLARNEERLRAHGVALPDFASRVAVVSEEAPATPDDEAEGVAGLPSGGSTPAPAKAAPESAPGEDAGGPAQATAAPRSGGRERRAERDHCEAICDLAAATCDLESKICDLARDHTGDPRYQSACSRAGQDCSAAQEACRACAG